MGKIIGIDISKATFDVAFELEGNWQHYAFTNDPIGFEALIEHLENDGGDHCVMEASGPYYLPLASYLHHRGIAVSVVNPLIIKQYGLFRMLRTKTDKQDAKLIADYGMNQKPQLWAPDSKLIMELRQIMTAMQGIDKALNITINQLEAFISSGSHSDIVLTSLNEQVDYLKNQKKKLYKTLLTLVMENFKETYNRLTSIPGIGPKTAVLLIAITDNFTKFAHVRQLIAYVGLSPRVYQSGTSVKGKGHICKMGNGMVRKNLYLCAWSAKRVNDACIAMYKRLKQKGKHERVIKVAIANKLLKQAFAVVASSRDFMPNYAQNICK